MIRRLGTVNLVLFFIAIILTVIFLTTLPQNALRPIRKSMFDYTTESVFQPIHQSLPNHSAKSLVGSVRKFLMRPKIELTLRMPLKKDMLIRIFCDMLRSTALFWSSDYGDVVIILDNEDKPQDFSSTINALGLPHKFRIIYEADFKRKDYIKELGRKNDRPYGYLRMYYSSFIMDWYTTEDAVVGWTDSDTVFTIPVTDESIFRNGKLIVKGINQFSYEHVRIWNQTTHWAIGYPMVSDFMSYFPTHIFASTLKNCRNYMMKRFNTTTFEDAYIKVIERHILISPVNVIFSYAYYFEKDLYDWHIDIAPEPSLKLYNEKALPMEAPLLESDITPDLHVTVHTRYYREHIKAFEQAICYTQIALGMSNIPHCNAFRDKINLQLFEFQSQQTHVNSWCQEGEKRQTCKKIIDDRYKVFVDHYKKEGRKINTSHIKVIEDFATKKYDINCYKFNYVPYA